MEYNAKVNELLRTLRTLRVLVLHPHDREGEILIEQLNRIGCQVETSWPLPATLPPTSDIVFVTVKENALDELRDVCNDDRPLMPTLIAMIDYESPLVLQAVIDINADAVMTRPIRSIGVLTNLVAARQVWLREKYHREKVYKLQRKVKGIQKISQAKTILMTAKQITEDEAYKLIRERAMSKRVTTEEMAVSIINANELLQSI
ncbi:MAG: ANTAR domain-containing protein [Gammaproteobacteria bacterium]|nr:ANTAR domain-containing protein [Gammaproteobacteria bacterium]